MTTAATRVAAPLRRRSAVAAADRGARGRAVVPGCAVRRRAAGTARPARDRRPRPRARPRCAAREAVARLARSVLRGWDARRARAWARG